MEHNNNFQALAACGQALGLSIADMEKITVDAAVANECVEDCSPIKSISAVAGENDPKVLWLGAVLYGYILDACTVIDEVEE